MTVTQKDQSAVKDSRLKEFALHLFRQKQVFINRAVMLASQPVLPLNFGDVKQLKQA